MPQPRKLYLGPFQPNLETALADEIAAYKNANGALAPLTVVVPTHLLGLHLRRRLAPHANIHFETLDALLAIPAAPRLGLELLCRRIAKSCADYFAPVNDTTGFASALLETFKDLEQAGIANFTGQTRKLRELAAAYKIYRQWFADHGFLLPQLSNLKSPTFLYGFYDLTTVQKQFVERLAPAAVFFPVVDHSDFSRPLLDWFDQSVGRVISCAATSGDAAYERAAASILSCPGEPAEVREAFRAVLRYVSDTGKTFNDCAILCRSREQYDAIIRDTARALGLPVYFRGGRPLAEHSDAKLLPLLLEVIRSDYSRAAVMELACHIGPHSQWDARTVELGIVAGKAQWKRASHDPELSEFIERLFAALDKIPRKGKWSEFIGPTLAALGRSRAGVGAVVESLAEFDAFESPISFETFAEFCQKAIDSAREPSGKFRDGGIFFGDVMSARGLSFDFVVVLGMVEKSFPRIIREDPLLLDDERAPLGLPLKRAGYAEEHLLFDLACGTARDRLVLSYPRLDPATARPRLASFLLQQFDVEHENVKLAEFERGKDALDAREFDLALLKGKVPASLLAEMSPHLAQGLTAERARWGESNLTAYDGIVPAAGGVPDASATQLETFAFCPFKYFAGHVLGLERWDEPERIWSADPGEIGSAVHDILERFYKQATLPLQSKLRVTYRRELRDIVLARLAEFEKTNVTGLPVVWSLRRAALLRDLLRFLDFEIARADALVPREFERNFGPVPLKVSPKLTLSLRGRIDRIDVGGGAARILDYKTGKAWHKKNDALDGGEALQLPLYALVAKEALGLPVESSEYAYLTSRGGYRYVKFTREGLLKRSGDLAQILETLTMMMRAGEFPQYTEHGVCAWCEFRLICGNAIAALADRKRDDPRLAPFHAVKKIK